jgi:hypothetical protein
MRFDERDWCISVAVQPSQLAREIVSLPRALETLQHDPRLSSRLVFASLDRCRKVEVLPRLDDYRRAASLS